MSPAPPDRPLPPVTWHLVVPVKEAVRAKSRLEAPHPLSRPVLARAVAEDTLEQACRAVPPSQVVVVTSDPHAGRFARGSGAVVVPDPGTGLNAAVRAGLASAGPATPTPGARDGWAVLLGDLPALRAEDLLAALARCAAYPACVVPDADGTGTVLLTSTVGPPRPRFGSGSARRHALSATVLPLDLPHLRRDVDTAADLRTAVALGVGPRTAAALGLSDA
ncbi:2-phospho-L-lactate guanylyltransferase [Ornithinimicrobium flavum]|uniref:2-phospho-L-lactate guanylyltransferase n=1 Tax=Ornithinimicrobium flavum TaxID=1288636 RepID=UPI001EE87BA5|nr:2-phospho-L-lactate guanylyltransferase [Ornithinimicrobium flavum]